MTSTSYLTTLAWKSFLLDLEILLIKSVHVVDRCSFLSQKYLAIEIGLDREIAECSNLSLLSEIHMDMPKAKIVKFGRAFGEKAHPLCQDTLISLKG
jgi:hypothetical protein